jgi:serine/threonine-protein kinase RsbW
MTEPSFVTLPGTLEAVAGLRDCIVKRAQAAGLTRKAIYNLCLAVDEIATNVVLHGYQEAGRTGILRIGTTLDEEEFTVIVEDESAPFDATRHALPTAEDLARPLEERTVGGLGIFLALRGVDALQYESAPGINRHIFVVKRRSPREAEGPTPVP